MPKNRPISRSSKEQRAVDTANRLTARDRAVLLAIYEHKVLLTEQIQTLFFRSLRRAQDRLRELADLGLIERWHPPQERGKGKASGYWFLRDPGARIVAAMKGVPRSNLPWMPRERLVNDKHLPHRIGVHSFFCTLVEASLENEGHGLYTWTPEKTVRTSGGWIRHDGFGRYIHPDGACDFYLEYDRGTETQAQIADKLAGYIGVARDWTEEGAKGFPTLLIVCPGAAREGLIARAFEDAFARFKYSPKIEGLPFFITSEPLLSDVGVLGRVWAPLNALDKRLSIIELPAQTGINYSLSKCLGRYWRDDCEDRNARILPLSNRPRFRTGTPPKDARGRFRRTAP